MFSFLKAWMLSLLSVEDNIILSVKDVKVHLICYHFWSIGCYLFLKVSKCYHFRVLLFMLSFGVIIYFMLSFNVIIFWCYHLMLSFGVIIWCYHLFYVIIWCYLLTVSKCYHFCVIIFLVQDGCYHLCYHLMLSFFVIIPPFFLFPENVIHSKKTGLFLIQIRLELFLQYFFSPT